MPALFNQGFFVREPAWHRLGVVLDEYPGREEAMLLAGHDFDIIERPVYVQGRSLDPQGSDESLPAAFLTSREGLSTVKGAEGWKALVAKSHSENPDVHGNIISLARDSYVPVQNSTCWDIIDALVDQPNVNYETGATLADGAQCFVTAWVDEPVQVPGDDSPVYPYIAVNWRHDGGGAVKAIKTSVREVCANTVAMAESEAASTGLEYTFRHTRNVHERIEDARMALAGIGAMQSAFMDMACKLAVLDINERQRERFIVDFLPSPPDSLISDRVRANIEEARTSVRSLLLGSRSIPDAHRETGYGLLLAGTEYLDHLRGYRNDRTYVGRTLLNREPLKDKLVPLIKEVAAA